MKEVPEDFVLLQRTNGKASHAACINGSQWHGFLFEKINGNWVSVRKLTDWEISQSEDMNRQGKVFNHCTVRA